jgi:hypothetical protein
MTLPSVSTALPKCPSCGGLFEQGYILGLPYRASHAVYLYPAETTIGWISRSPEGRGYRDQREAEPLTTPQRLRGTARFRASRCRQCQRIEFEYRDPVYGPKEDPRSQDAQAPKGDDVSVEPDASG